MLDASTQSVIILFVANVLFLAITLVGFGIIRRFRGDRAKVKINKKVLKEMGYDESSNNEFDALLLENPTTRIIRRSTIRSFNGKQTTATKSKYEWFKLLIKMSEKELKQICGSDVALYLAYLKYCAILFLIIAICSNSFLLPLYLYLGGNYQESNLSTDTTSTTVTTVAPTSFLSSLTLLNVQNEVSAIWGVFFFTVVYSMLGHSFLYFLEEKRKELQGEFNEEASDITEVEIAMHSVILKGINNQVPLKWATEVFNFLFLNGKEVDIESTNIPTEKKKFDNLQTQIQEQKDQENSTTATLKIGALLKQDDDISQNLLQIHIIGDYMRMLHFLRKLEKTKLKRQYYEKQYKEKKQIVKKQYGSLCWKEYGPNLKDYYAQRPNIIKRQIESEKKKKEKSNFGIAFFTMKSAESAQNLIKHLKDIRKELKLHNKELYYKLGANHWTMQTAPCPSDIIWENFQQTNIFYRISKIFLLNLFLFIVSCILLNPFMIYSIVEPLVNRNITEAGVIKSLFLSSIQPLTIFIFNYVFIPTLVDWISYYEEYKNKSDRHRFNLFKQFFFIMINAVFIPISQSKTIETFLKYVINKDMQAFSLELSTNFLSSSEFFLRYIIQLTFLTNIVQILDIPHYLYMIMKRILTKKYYEQEVEDDWYFDIGYNYAFVITVFIIIFVFSASVPLIPLFGFFFFFFKYYIDKYNFVFVYPNEFESKGTLADPVSKYTAFGLFLFQLSMCGVFTSIFGQDFVLASVILVIGEIFYMSIFTFFNTSELRETFREVLQEQGMGNENDWERLSILTIKKGKSIADLNSEKITEKHIQILKEAYQHPYEKYNKEENAKRLLNILLAKEIKKRVELTASHAPNNANNLAISIDEYDQNALHYEHAKQFLKSTSLRKSMTKQRQLTRRVSKKIMSPESLRLFGRNDGIKSAYTKIDYQPPIELLTKEEEDKFFQ